MFHSLRSLNTYANKQQRNDDGLKLRVSKHMLHTWKLYSVQSLRCKAEQRLICMHADEYNMEDHMKLYTKERVGFVGDAAHAVSPLLAQGGLQRFLYFAASSNGVL